MPAYIYKQPNGKYGRFSTVVDCPTDINMFPEEAFALGHKEISFEEMCERFEPNNVSQECFEQYCKEVSN